MACLRVFGFRIRLLVVGVVLGLLATMANSKEDKDQVKVAVIGSGMGGSTCTHFLRRLLGVKARIDVFERNDRVGGRADIINVGGKEYECGGSVIHSANKYLVDFAKQCGLKQKKESKDDKLGLYDGKEFVYLQSDWQIISLFKLFWRYGWSLVKMNNMVSETLKSFVKLYDLQEEGRSFDTVRELLDATGDPKLYKYTQESSKKMLEDAKVSDKLINELFTGISRMNYGQDSLLTGFTGFVSLAGGQSGNLWSVEGGNYQIPKCLIENSKANLHLKSKVISISKVDIGSERSKYKLNIDGVAVDTEYDAVVVAAPLEVKDDYLTCRDCKNWPSQKHMGYYQTTVATFVQGHLSAKRFGMKDERDIPAALLTMEKPDIYFSCIGRQSSVSDHEAQDVYKVFSRQPLTKEQLDDLFSERAEVKEKVWLAYPHYTPPERFDSFRLDSGVFYINPIERAASAMEMSALSGRNAALLAQRYLASLGTLPPHMPKAKAEL